MSEKKIKDLTYIRLLNSKREQGTLSIGDSIGDDSVGGEGQVLKLLSLSNYNCDEFVIKVFHDLERNADKENKIKDMLSLSEKYDIPNTVCWPFAIVYDKDKFVGYLMKKAQGVSLSKFMHGKKTQSEFNNYKDCHYAQICLSIMNTVQKLHQYDILVGDINEDNFIVNNPNMVYFIDTDSYQFGKYKCNVGRENYFSPEYYETQMLDENSEGYSIIILIFKILMLGRDPFTSRLNEELSKKEKVIKGLFPYNINDDITKKLISPPFYFELWNKLSLDLKYYFINIFTRYEVYNGTFDIISILEQYLDDCNETSSNSLDSFNEKETGENNTNNDYIIKKGNPKKKNIEDVLVVEEKKSESKVTTHNTGLPVNKNADRNDLLVICREAISKVLIKKNIKLKDMDLIDASTSICEMIKDELNDILPNKIITSCISVGDYEIVCDDLNIKISSSDPNIKIGYNTALRMLYQKIFEIDIKENANISVADLQTKIDDNYDNTSLDIVDNKALENETISYDLNNSSSDLLTKCQSIIEQKTIGHDIVNFNKKLCDIIMEELNKILVNGVSVSLTCSKNYHAKCPDLGVKAVSRGPSKELNYVSSLRKLFKKIMEKKEIYSNCSSNNKDDSSQPKNKNTTIKNNITEINDNEMFGSAQEMVDMSTINNINILSLLEQCKTIIRNFKSSRIKGKNSLLDINECNLLKNELEKILPKGLKFDGKRVISEDFGIDGQYSGKKKHRDGRARQYMLNRLYDNILAANPKIENISNDTKHIDTRFFSSNEFSKEIRERINKLFTADLSKEVKNYLEKTNENNLQILVNIYIEWYKICANLLNKQNTHKPTNGLIMAAYSMIPKFKLNINADFFPKDVCLKKNYFLSVPKSEITFKATKKSKCYVMFFEFLHYLYKYQNHEEL